MCTRVHPFTPPPGTAPKPQPALPAHDKPHPAFQMHGWLLGGGTTRGSHQCNRVGGRAARPQRRAATKIGASGATGTVRIHPTTPRQGARAQRKHSPDPARVGLHLHSNIALGIVLRARTLKRGAASTKNDVEGVQGWPAGAGGN